MFLRVLTVFFCSVSFYACAESNFTGYLKSYAIAQDKIDNDLIQLDKLYRTQTSSRLMLDYFSERQVWQLHYEVGLETNSYIQRFTEDLRPANARYRLTDIRPFIGATDQKNSIPQNLDRLNVQFQLDSGDLTIGRQAITFGSARIINPTDVFLPFDVTTLNTEYRVGIDAIRFQKPLGQLGELDLGIVLGDDAKPENSAAFFRLQTNVSGRDLQFTAIRFTEQNLFGFGIQSSIKDLGLWFETAYVSGDKDYIRSSLGTDYAFTESIFGMLEYHYNGAGSSEPGDYISSQNDIAYRSGGVFLLGKHYLIPALTYQVNALLGLSAQAIYNLDDKSVFVNLAADYNLSENLYLGLGIYLFSGDDFELSDQGQFSLGSEYGGNPNSIFANLRYYF